MSSFKSNENIHKKEDRTHFQFPSSSVHQRRNQKKNEDFIFRANPCTVCIVSYWASAMNKHSLWIHISQLSHWTALWPFRTAPLQRSQSALQFVQYQAPSPDSILKSSLSQRFEHEAWKRFSHPSHLRSLSDALQYFLHKPHWNLGPGFISTCMKKPWVLSYPLSSPQRRLWSDWADAQADLSLRLAHSHFVGFVMRRLKYCHCFRF